MFLGRACAESEVCICVPGDQGRSYELRVLRDHEGPVYRLGLAGAPSTELPGYSVLEALRWLGVDPGVLNASLQDAVAAQTLRLYDYYCQGRTLLGADRAPEVDERAQRWAEPMCIFAWSPDPAV